MSLSDAANDYATYPALRQVLAPELAIAPSHVIRSHMDAEFGEGSADAYNEYLESLWGDIGKFVSKAAPVVANVGGGIVQGAMSGSSLGLPGIIGGTVAGGAGKALSSYGGGGTLGKIGGALTGVTNIAGQFSPMGRMGSAIGPAISGLAGIGKPGGAAGAASGLLNGLLGVATGGAGGGALGSLLGPVAGAGGAGGALSSLLGRAGVAGGPLGSLLGGGGGGAGGAFSAISGLFGASDAEGVSDVLNALSGASGTVGNVLGALGAGPGAGAASQAIGGVLGALGSGGGLGGAISSLVQNPATAQAISGLFGGSSAAGQLASFLRRPETQQAFAALQLGKLGRPTVPVGAARAPVPVAAFPEVLSHLADQVAVEAAEWSGDAEASLGYMQDAEGDYVGDPAFSRDRAGRVWDLLNEAQAERVLVEMAEAAPRAPAAAPRRTFEAEAEGWNEWDSDADSDWADTMDMLDSASDGDSEWGDSEWGDNEWENEAGFDSESSDNEYEYETESEYADA